METEKRGPAAISLVVVVCDREKREKVIDAGEQSRAFFNLLAFGKGTANSKILGYLGLGETEKAVTFKILPTLMADILMEKLDEKLDLKKPGHGIAFRADIQAGCFHTVKIATPENLGGEKMKPESSHDLVIVVVNRGYTEEVMDAARSAGATGGTVLHAKGCGLEGAERFFGVTIQPEKELILIVAKGDTGCGIMEAIAGTHGPGTDASAVSFSMPVHHVLGVGSDVPVELV